METMGSESTFQKSKRGCTDKYNRAGMYITSDEGKILQKAMWNEVVDVLEEKIPRVKDAVASLSEGKTVS